MSPEVKCLHPTSSRREISTFSISNVIYHKFSHGAAFYMLNGKNVNVMLEFLFASLFKPYPKKVYMYILLKERTDFHSEGNQNGKQAELSSLNMYPFTIHHNA